jgi:hypothetical protein
LHFQHFACWQYIERNTNLVGIYIAWRANRIVLSGKKKLWKLGQLVLLHVLMWNNGRWRKDIFTLRLCVEEGEGVRGWQINTQYISARQNIVCN